MKRTLFLLVFVVAIAAWCTPSFATQIVLSGGAAPGVNLNSTGISDGVWMSTSSGGSGANTYLNVLAGDSIFTGNSSGGTVTNSLISAAYATNASFAFLKFNGNSDVFGTIGVDGGGKFKDITLAGGSGTTVNFWGTVITETMKVATGTANFNSGTGTNAAAVTFTGDGGTVGVAANTTVTGALLTLTDEKGTLSLGNMSQWTGAVGDASGSKGLAAINVVGNSATITGDVYSHSFSLSSNTLNIDGALTIGPAGVINTTLNSASDYGQIVKLSGATTLPAALGINATVPTTAYIPVGTQFNIVQSAAGTGGDVITVTDPTNPLFTFTAAPAVHGQATISLAGTPVTSASNPVGTVLDTVPSSPDLDVVRNAINNLTSTSAINDAESQLAPSTPSLAAPLETFYGIRQFQNLWASHLDMCSQDVNQPPDANCQGNKPRSGWWVKGFEYEGRQSAQEESTGYHSRILGGMIAYDRPIGENTRGGLGFGYARGTINGDKFDASTNFNTYNATAYIGHEFGPWFVNGGASVGWSEYSSVRHIVYPGVDRTAKAEYRGQAYTGFVSTGYHFYAKKFTITPIASLQYTRMHLNGYTETGAGDVNLRVKSQSYNFLESGLGMKVERSFKDSHGRTYVPEGHFNWFHEFANPDLGQTARYTAAGSSSFKTSGLRTDDNTFNVGGGLTLLSCVCSSTTWSLEAVYDHYWNNTGYSANQVMMRFTSRF